MKEMGNWSEVQDLKISCHPAKSGKGTWFFKILPNIWWQCIAIPIAMGIGETFTRKVEIVWGICLTSPSDIDLSKEKSPIIK